MALLPMTSWTGLGRRGSFSGASCGAAEMSRSLLAFGEATVEASVSMFITEVGTTAACGNYNVDARLHLAE